MKFGQ
jgi:hypothetical protein